MKRVLSLDASTWWGGVALLEQSSDEASRVVCEAGVLVRNSHSVHLLGWIGWLLDQAGWSRGSLDGFVATCGPGSFTGIRVGLGTIRGLALSADRPCVGVTTLDALAEAHGAAERDRLALLSAGRGEIYAARYDAASSPVRALGDPWRRRIAAIPSDVIRDTVIVCAPGSERDSRAVAAAGESIRVAPPPRGVAGAAGRLALMRGELATDSVPPLRPLYLRPSDAELKAGRR